MKRVLFVILSLTLGCCSSAVYLIYDLDGPTRSQGQIGASPLIEALETHRQGWGKFPNETSELIPDFLVAVPIPSWRSSYQFQACSGNTDYILWFHVGRDIDDYCGFQYSKNEWICTDSAIPVMCK